MLLGLERLLGVLSRSMVREVSLVPRRQDGLIDFVRRRTLCSD